jgi:drug/metabolite transporter (DMT)-like permease
MLETRRLMRALRPSAREAQMTSFFDDDVNAGALSPRRRAAVCLAFVALTTLKMLVTKATAQSDGAGTGHSHYAYNIAAAVFMAELFKFVFSVGYSLFLASRGEVNLAVEGPTWRTLALYMVPSTLYAFDNNLNFVALEYLSVPTIQTLASVKIVFSGLLSHFFLGRKLRRVQWVAIVALTVGVAVSRMDGGSSHAIAAPRAAAGAIGTAAAHTPAGAAVVPLAAGSGRIAIANADAAVDSNANANAVGNGNDADDRGAVSEEIAAGRDLGGRFSILAAATPTPSAPSASSPPSPSAARAATRFTGVVIVVSTALIAAVASLACALLLSQHPERSIHPQNSQLYIGGMAVNLVLLFFDGSPQPWFANFTPAVWAIVLINASIGISVSIMFKHLGIVTEVIASIVTTVLLMVLSVMFFGFRITPAFAIGAAIAMGGFYTYYAQPRLPCLPGEAGGYAEIPADIDEDDDGLDEFNAASGAGVVGAFGYDDVPEDIDELGLFT